MSAPEIETAPTDPAPAPGGAGLTCWWLSWYSEHLGAFELHSPWWISGYAYDYRGDEEIERATVCAAVRAATEEDAKAVILASHDDKTVVLEWRFCEDKGPDYDPFGGRFPRAAWMVWP